MKKVIIFLALLALSLCAFSCGGTGSGSADSPSGENPGIPSVVQLLPSHFIAQTNSSIILHAKVLDGNGVAVPNTPVTFTNLTAPFGILSGTSANTDSLGIATVTIHSTSPGPATIVAQVNNGVSNVRDTKTVFFTDTTIAVSMSLDVDSVPDSHIPPIFNETSDFTLFSPPPDPDDTVVILATVFDAWGLAVPGESISWFSDLTGDNVIFLPGTESITDEDGQARAVVQVTPESIRNTETHLNIMALAGNGAVNMVTLFLEPVFVSSVAVSAKPQVMAPNGASNITTIIKLNTGAPAPNGTAVSFATTCGTIDPFAEATGGIADATYTAPSEVPAGNICTVTATAAGVSGSRDVTVRLALKVSPTSASICEVSGSCAAGVANSATFTITGGVPTYTVTSDNTAVIPNPTVTGNSFTVPSPGGDPISANTTVTLTITDSSDGVATVTVTVIDVP